MAAVRHLEFYGTNNNGFGTFVTVIMFSTLVTFWYTRDMISVPYTGHHS